MNKNLHQVITKCHKTVPTYNDMVRQAYQQILKQTKALLSGLEDESLRYLLINKNLPVEYAEEIVEHEVIGPLIYLRLQQFEEYKLKINFGFDTANLGTTHCDVTTAFLRILYKFTMSGSTAVNIEDCILTDYLITECEMLFSYTDERSQDYDLLLLPYKPKPVKRNLKKAA